MADHGVICQFQNFFSRAPTPFGAFCSDFVKTKKAKGKMDRENETEGTRVPELRKIFRKKISVRFRETFFLLLSFISSSKLSSNISPYSFSHYLRYLLVYHERQYYLHLPHPPDPYTNN